MSKKKVLLFLISLFFGVLSNFAVITLPSSIDDSDLITLCFSMKAPSSSDVIVSYSSDNSDVHGEEASLNSKSVSYSSVNDTQTFTFNIPATAEKFFLLPTDTNEEITLSPILISYNGYSFSDYSLYYDQASSTEMIASIEANENGFIVGTGDSRSSFTWNLDSETISDFVGRHKPVSNYLPRILTCILIDLLLIYCFVKAGALFEIPLEVIHNHKLVFSLAKNDFKTKFAGSYLGVIWAFIQPVVTILVYWFVFQKAMGVGEQPIRSGGSAPYILWLTAGLVPWFYFSDTLSQGTNALIDYNYLVKKVVFKISVLPTVKAVSNLFVHIFFVCFMLVIYLIYGYYPDLYWLQLIYYSGCMFVFLLGLIYLNSAIVVFFRDLSQLVNVILQIWIWATPIMWNIDTMNLNGKLLSVFKLNPMYYIINGYRDSMLNKVWFWEHPKLTILFWVVTVLVFGFGVRIFRRLKVHFADVL